jgi:hypothetical protein
MLSEFSELFKKIKKLRSRYLNTLSAYKVYDCINNLSASNKVGKKKSSKNVETLNDFKYFFIISKEACRCYFLIEIAKFFDRDTRALTVFNVLDYSEENLNKLTKEYFLRYHKDRKILPELFKNYEELKLLDINKMREKIKLKRGLIEKLITYRNKFLAHDDVNKIRINITAKEVEQILNLIRGIIDIYYLKLDFSTNSYRNYKEMPVADTVRLIKYLQKH